MEARTGVATRTWAELDRPESAAAWALVAPALAARLRAGAGELAVAMRERIRSELPELLASPDEEEINRASNESNLLLVADLLEAGAEPAAARLPTPTRAYAEFGADHDTPMAGLLRAYRLGHAFAWEVALAALTELIEDKSEFAVAAGLLSTWLHAFADAIVCQVEEVYATERERWLRSSSALRAELVRSIVDGVAVDHASASRRLGYGLDRCHVCVIASVEEADGGGDALAEGEAAIAAIAAAAGCPPPLLHPLGLAATAGWLSGADRSAGERIAAAAATASGSLRIAVGEPGEGLDGFRRSYREATEARRVAGGHGDRPTRYGDVALRALATVDSAQAGEFVRERLGPLLDPEQASARLTETLAAFLDEGGSPGRAAGRLGVHENTVRYRLRQIEDLLGRPVGPGDLELRVALELANDVGG